MTKDNSALRIAGIDPPRPISNRARVMRSRRDDPSPMDCTLTLTDDQLLGDWAAWKIGMGDDPVWSERRRNKLRVLKREMAARGIPAP